VKAWLLTWTWLKYEPAESLVAILSSRKSDRSVAELMELLVLRSQGAAVENAHYAHRPKPPSLKAQTPLLINRVPHGDRVLCGYDPWLYGRKVSDLHIVLDRAANEEVLSWREPDDYAWAEPDERTLTPAAQGKPKQLRRPNGPLSADALAKWRTLSPNPSIERTD